MADDWGERRGEERRREDRELATWRGEISTRVSSHERQISTINDRLDGIGSSQSATRQDVAVIKRTISDQGEDIAQSQASNRAILLYLIFPLIVAILGGLILFVAIGHPR